MLYTNKHGECHAIKKMCQVTPEVRGKASSPSAEAVFSEGTPGYLLEADSWSLDTITVFNCYKTYHFGCFYVYISVAVSPFTILCNQYHPFPEFFSQPEDVTGL